MDNSQVLRIAFSDAAARWKALSPAERQAVHDRVIDAMVDPPQGGTFHAGLSGPWDEPAVLQTPALSLDADPLDEL